MDRPTFDEEITERFRRRLKMNQKRLINIIVFNLIGYIVLYFMLFWIRGIDFANEYIFLAILSLIAIQGVALFGYVYYLLVNEIPNEIDNERRTENELLKEAVKKQQAEAPMVFKMGSNVKIQGFPLENSIVKRFSSNLEKIKKERIKAGWEITGIGLGFLDRIKTAPPFLGLSHDKPIISPLHEKELTEFFQASIYMEKYRDVIKGGRHIIRDGENDRKTIAKIVYGAENYDYYVPEYYKYPSGSILELPYLNLTRTDHPDDIKRIIAKSKELEGIISILESYNLTRREAIPLLRMVYEAAQKTLEEEKEGEVSFIKYDRLTLEEDAAGSHVEQHARFGAGLLDEIKLWVIVRNGDKQVYDCEVMLDNFEFFGDQPDSQWTRAYRGFEMKTMKWRDVGRVTNDGKIELYENRLYALEIAKAVRKHPDIHMQLSYLDGYSTSTYSLDGKYRAVLSVYGKVLVENVKKPIKALRYTVTFKYEQFPLLRILEIKKLEE